MSDRFEIGENHNVSDVFRYLVQSLVYEEVKINELTYEGGNATVTDSDELTKGMTPQNNKDSTGYGRFKMNANHLGLKNTTDLAEELENSNSGIMSEGNQSEYDFYQGFGETKLASKSHSFVSNLS